MVRKFAPRRPRARKPALAKAKKVVAKATKKKAARNMDTFFFKAKSQATLIPQQGVKVANYQYNTFSLDPTGVPSQSNALYLSNAEFNLYRLQYDKFRVNSVKIRVVPKANVLDIANNNNDSAFNTVGDGLMHTVVDRDSIAPANIPALTRYPSYRKFDIKKSWTRSYAIKYPTGIWIDCQNPGGFTLTQQLGLLGGITMYAENLFEDNYEVWNEPYAAVHVEYNIVFQGKTSSSLVPIFNETTGALDAITMVRAELYANPAQCPLTNIRGTFADSRRTITDLSGTDMSGVDVPTGDVPDQ